MAEVPLDGEDERPTTLPLLPDIFSSIAAHLSYAQLLAFGRCSRATRRLVEAGLPAMRHLALSGSRVDDNALMDLVHRVPRLELLDVSSCAQLSKRAVASAASACAHLQRLVAVRVGGGEERRDGGADERWWAGVARGGIAWMAHGDALGALLHGAPPHAALELDCKLAVNLPLPTRRLADGRLRLSRVVLAADMGTEAADPAGAWEAGGEPHPDGHGAALRQLAAALLPHSAHLTELDARSGCLGPRAAELLLAPLLCAPHAALAILRCSSLPPAAALPLGRALLCNRSLRVLAAGAAGFSSADAVALAPAIAAHPTLTRLSLEHNSILDSGAAAIAHAIATSSLAHLTLSFTGAADGAAEALACSLTAGCSLRHLNLCGNCMGAPGVLVLARALGTGNTALEELSLSANSGLRAASSDLLPLLRVLPKTSLRRLQLAGCAISHKTTGLLASILPATGIEELDLSANPLGDRGAWDFAWAIPDCKRLRTLNLSDCGIGDDGGDEMLGVLSATAVLERLDLRGNYISKQHGLTEFKCVDMIHQRGLKLFL
ncbi:hypothetical protein AB1Y20_013700 [Prymnesium parvum]|uniref:Uncharacterized protein n=1 Tax=Prymnesium parvum TaxID=97485 RepID=A0AB34II14_PRYPA